MIELTEILPKLHREKKQQKIETKRSTKLKNLNAERRDITGCKVITLCGSTKFKEDYERINRQLTLLGNIVISVGFFGHSGDYFTDEQKVMLDELHKRKIDISDAIFVINKGGYIGKSTESEIAYAKAHGKEILYLEAIIK